MLKNLKKLREESNITQKQLADIIGVSQQSINKYENHNIEPDIETLIRIADYFDTTVDYLIGRKDCEENTFSSNALPNNEKKLLASYHSLTNAQKQALLQLVVTMHDHND